MKKETENKLTNGRRKGSKKVQRGNANLQEAVGRCNSVKNKKEIKKKNLENKEERSGDRQDRDGKQMRDGKTERQK